MPVAVAQSHQTDAAGEEREPIGHGIAVGAHDVGIQTHAQRRGIDPRQHLGELPGGIQYRGLGNEGRFSAHHRGQQQLHALHLRRIAQMGQHGGCVLRQLLRWEVPAGPGGAQHQPMAVQLRRQTDAAVVVTDGGVPLLTCRGGKRAAIGRRR